MSHQFLRFSGLNFVLLAVLALFLTQRSAWSDGENPLSPSPSYVGTFADAKISVTLTDAGQKNLSGSITQAGKHFPLKATLSQQGLAGAFEVANAAFPFTATLQNNTLTFVTGHATYALSRVGGGDPQPVNPLDQADPAPPSTQSAPDAAGGEALGGFSVLGTTENGKTLFLNLPETATTVQTAITQTADAVGKICDRKLKIDGAFADQSQLRGGATFTTVLKGQSMRGWIFCSASKAREGAKSTATVVLASANDTPADVQTLFAYLPAQSQMKTHAFPDNSGSVDLPPGWTTKSTSITHGAMLEGPAGQAVISGLVIPVSTPDCQLLKIRQHNHEMQMQIYQSQVQQQQQILARSRAMRMSPPPLAPPTPPPPFEADPTREMPSILFCRTCDGPADVLRYFYPALAAHQQKLGQVYTTIDKVLEQAAADGNPQIPGDKAGVVYLAVTDHDGEKLTHFRALDRVETWPIQDGKDVWQISINSMRAPDATFDRDFPTMSAIVNSVKLNQEEIAKQFQQETNASMKMMQASTNAILERGKMLRQQQDDNFNRFESQMQAQQKAYHDSNTDFIEMLRGTRDVYDNQTGSMHSVDYYHVDGIVNGMNQAANDPNRFQQILLRYEQ